MKEEQRVIKKDGGNEGGADIENNIVPKIHKCFGLWQFFMSSLLKIVGKKH